MVDRQVHGWIRAQDERTGSWARLPRPEGALLEPAPDPWAAGHRGSTPFPQPSAGRPVSLRSAGPAPSRPSPAGSRSRPRPHPWHQPTPGPWREAVRGRGAPATPDPGSPSASPERPDPAPRSQPTPGHQPTPRHQPTPAPQPPGPATPRVIPLGGDLALVSVGQWDEESATTIQMPAIADEPEAPEDPAEGGRPVSDRD